MKKLILPFLLFLILFSKNIYSQFPVECNTGVTTELTSSSNSKPGVNYWQGWACGINGVIIKSLPNAPGSGQWINLTGHGVPTNVNLTNICAVDAQNAFVTGTSGANTWVWKTTNGGANFFQVFSQTNGFINAVFMKNNLRGFMEGNPVGGRWSLWKTINGGLNWDSTGLFLPQAGSETGFPNSLCIPVNASIPTTGDTNKIWFGTNNSRIYYSSNYGTNWIVQSTSPEQNIYCIAYGMDMSYTSRVFAGGLTNLLRSTNYGTNWVTETVSGSGKISGINLCWYQYCLTRENKIYWRNFSSGTWSVIYTAPAGTFVYFDNRSFGMWVDHYAVRNNGGILFITEGEEVKKISSSVPSSFVLYNNYPNPFNPTTKIIFDVSSNVKVEMSNVKLSIFDVTGKEIQILVNEQLIAGKYEVEWDASNNPSGVYFYKVQCGEFTDVKKMVLIK